MNKFQFMGRLTRDPEVRSTTTGTQVTAFSLAVNRRFANQNGERQTDFFNLTAFGKTAEFCAKYFRKGAQVLVEGRIQNRTWEDQNGQKRYATDFIVEDTYFADSKRDQTGGDIPMAMAETSNDTIVDGGEYITVDDTTDLPF
ncbi:MAG: single-stranded DNA-binding protein [Clostridia bacterium]|nr:single-stranded DNA-binding protein [Clostridia bacterium]